MTAATSTFEAFDTVHDREAAAMRRLDALGKMLDSAFSLPIVGTRIGADALLNLIPGAGVVVAKGLSAYLVYEAHRLGVPRALIARMLGNVVLDFAISAVPVAGWIGDVFFRANMRNLTILRDHLALRRFDPTEKGPRPTHEPVVIEGENRPRGKLVKALVTFLSVAAALIWSAVVWGGYGLLLMSSDLLARSTGDFGIPREFGDVAGLIDGLLRDYGTMAAAGLWALGILAIILVRALINRLLGLGSPRNVAPSATAGERLSDPRSPASAPVPRTAPSVPVASRPTPVPAPRPAPAPAVPTPVAQAPAAPRWGRNARP